MSDAFTIQPITGAPFVFELSYLCLFRTLERTTFSAETPAVWFLRRNSEPRFIPCIYVAHLPSVECSWAQMHCCSRKSRIALNTHHDECPLRSKDHEESKSRLKSGNAYSHAIILTDVLCGCETWSLTLKEARRLRVFEKRMLRRIFGPEEDEVTGE